MSAPKLRTLLTVVSLAATLGAALAPTGAFARGFGGGGGAHFGGGGGHASVAHFGGGGHFGGGHVGGGTHFASSRGGNHFGGQHFGGQHFGGQRFASHGGSHFASHHPGNHFGGHQQHFAAHHHWGHPYGIGGDYVGNDYADDAPVSPAPVAAVTPISSVKPATSGPAACAAANGSYVTVAFAANATAADITSFLQGYKADIADGPDADGVYRIKVGDRTMSQSEMANLVDAMRAQSAVVRYVAA